MVGEAGIEPTTKAFRFVCVTALPGLSLHLDPLTRVLGGFRLVSTPSARVSGLARDCPRSIKSRWGFPEFESCHPKSFPHGAPFDECPALTAELLALRRVYKL